MHKEMINYEIPVHGHEGELCSSVVAINCTVCQAVYLCKTSLSVNDTYQDGKESPAVMCARVPFLCYL